MGAVMYERGGLSAEAGPLHPDRLYPCGVRTPGFLRGRPGDFRKKPPDHATLPRIKRRGEWRRRTLAATHLDPPMPRPASRNHRAPRPSADPAATTGIARPGRCRDSPSTTTYVTP